MKRLILILLFSFSVIQVSDGIFGKRKSFDCTGPKGGKNKKGKNGTPFPETFRLKDASAESTYDNVNCPVSMSFDAYDPTKFDRGTLGDYDPIPPRPTSPGSWPRRAPVTAPGDNIHLKMGGDNGYGAYHSLPYPGRPITSDEVYSKLIGEPWTYGKTDDEPCPLPSKPRRRGLFNCFGCCGGTSSSEEYGVGCCGKKSKKKKEKSKKDKKEKKEKKAKKKWGKKCNDEETWSDAGSDFAYTSYT